MEIFMIIPMKIIISSAMVTLHQQIIFTFMGKVVMEVMIICMKTRPMTG